MTRQKQLTLQIRARLALADKSMGDLGEALGLSRASVSARMNGHRDFTFTELEVVADFLGLSMRDLFVFETEEGTR
ncbi:helix-turn-helix domain-containing protein [Micrococcus luteus]|uniref:helix-turn-helix domain-containing protein n=1 Tax=Micrococcus luteus TaxID=1270 RepID=UPI0019D287DA|nr:helix-turn-helix transcriptional regulator [Micrococcus luteus]MBN6751704.1 helix-turn-helix transcriptional regulator [Micrococcus luteus]MBN6761747.1 helix-turn-helix transcriptional regulator [Micrococcus luteus]MBN6802762.1 helix-turn-helix transcriptional regulator [Micrococcus luteus]MDT1991312.1 helix-turn-helix transcriptional regulator [Micrococcus luteus]